MNQTWPTPLANSFWCFLQRLTLVGRGLTKGLLSWGHILLDRNPPMKALVRHKLFANFSSGPDLISVASVEKYYILYIQSSRWTLDSAFDFTLSVFHKLITLILDNNTNSKTVTVLYPTVLQQEQISIDLSVICLVYIVLYTFMCKHVFVRSGTITICVCLGITLESMLTQQLVRWQPSVLILIKCPV